MVWAEQGKRVFLMKDEVADILHTCRALDPFFWLNISKNNRLS